MYSSSMHSAYAWFALVVFMLTGRAKAQFDYRYAFFDVTSPGDDIQFDATGDFLSFREILTGGILTQSASLPVIWDLRNAGKMYVLDTLGGSGNGARRVNDFGVIAGVSSLQSNVAAHAVIWDNLRIRDLGTLGGLNSATRDINDVPQIVGDSEYEVGNDDTVPFVWENGEMRELPNLGIRLGSAYGINESGQIVGWLKDSPGFYPVVVWENDDITILPDLVDDSFAWALNDQGIVAGESTTANGDPHAVIWKDGKIIDIHDQNLGSSSHGLYINNLNQVIGTAGPAFQHIAFIWEEGKGMTPLNDLVPPRLRIPWTVGQPRTINDDGQIATVAESKTQPGDLWAVLLSPVHPTMVLLDPWPGSAGTVNTFNIRSAPPGSKVYLMYSMHGGGTRIPGCNLQDNALQLDNPKIVGSARATAYGGATIKRFVPEAAAGKTILFQAVVVNDCAISQLVVHEFE